MTANSKQDHEFIAQLAAITEANLTNNQFGVSDLAKEMGMSRSNLHRRLKVSTIHSVSQFICKIRLEKAMEMLQEKSVPASEIAYNVGFNSPAYFSRCFHKYYGFPPGEAKKRMAEKGLDKQTVEFTQAFIEFEKPVGNGRIFLGNKAFVSTAIIVILLVLSLISYKVFILDEGVYKLSKKDKDLSIIVLPFDNFSDDPNNVSFADGIREDILNNLYWITALRVVSRTSAEQFRGSNLSAQEIARKMSVRYVLEGSVRRVEETVRISVQLIDAYSDNHLWSQNFDRKLDDIIGIQDEIALLVASELKTVLSENEIKKIEKLSTQNSKAYNYYLQARFLLHKANSPQRSGFNKAGAMSCIQYYEKAIAEDESFAEAYAGLANAWLKLSAWKFIPSNEGFLKGREFSLKALEIDPDCAEAHSVLGTFLIWAQRNFKEGGKELRTSIRLNPNFATSRQVYAQYLMITGPIEEARVHVNRALELEPYFWVVQNLNSWIYYFEEKYAEALETCEIAHDYNPDFSSNQWLFVLNYAKLGEGEKMVQQLQYIAKHYSKTDDYADDIQQAFDKNGIDGLFEWLIDINMNNPIKVEGMSGHPFFIAWWNAIIGNEEEAVFWLQRNMESKGRLYAYFNLIATNPDFDILRDDPLFLKIVDDIGLTPYHKRKAK